MFWSVLSFVRLNASQTLKSAFSQMLNYHLVQTVDNKGMDGKMEMACAFCTGLYCDAGGVLRPQRKHLSCELALRIVSNWKFLQVGCKFEHF